jgi:hypothetical protein
MSIDAKHPLHGAVDLPQPAIALLESIGLKPPYAANVLAGGKNNRVLKITPATDDPVVLKVYFRHPDDPRDRIGHEWAFSRYAWSHGIRSLPEPLAEDHDHAMAAFRFVAGTSFDHHRPGAEDVESAARFVKALNDHREAADAQTLPSGSEACFSVAQHLQVVEQRVRQLTSIAGPEHPAEVVDWIRDHLAPAWEVARTQVRSQLEAAGLSYDDVLPRDECVISPSDFGFHNAIRRPLGDVCYYDFEYAGWDDPAKLCCDFFNQVEVPVALDHLPILRSTLGTISRRPEQLMRRISALLPVYALKWCCICLGPFLRTGMTRRRFAGHVTDDLHRIAFSRAVTQLEKFRATLALDLRN